MGYMGKEPELRDVSGQPALVFSIASNDKRWGSDNTTWVKCTIWGNRATYWASRLKKGTKLFVSGVLSLDTYTGKNGKTSNLTLNVHHIEFAGASQLLDQQGEDAAPGADIAQAPAEEKPNNLLENDIPF